MSNKALLLHEQNAVPALGVRPIPVPAKNQLVVRNHAIALNIVDWKARDLYSMTHHFHVQTWPVIPGNDASGIVCSVGPGVTRFKPGDRVSACGRWNVEANQGTHQEYTVYDTSLVARMPDSVSFHAGAALSSGFGTAAGALIDVGLELPYKNSVEKKNDGEAILIWSGGSCVGFSAIQIAREAGATIFTTASPQHHDKLLQHGADVVLDYKSPTVKEDLQREAEARRVKLTRFVDAASMDLKTTAQLVSDLGGNFLAVMVPWQVLERDDPPAGVAVPHSGLVSLFKDRAVAMSVYNELLERMLAEGSLVGPRIQLVPGGLQGIEDGLNILRNGVSGVKLVLDV